MFVREFARVFTSWGPNTNAARIAVDACRNGFAVVPVKPGGKIPICTLTARELKAAGERHACAAHHAITDPKVARRVFDRLAKTGDVNIGVVAYPSRIVVVDADTPEALAGFCSRWAQATEDEGYLRHSPTVRTPGTADHRHHDGGHFYFWLPEGVILDESPGQLILAEGGDVRWGWFMTVVPPSTRPEGRYETLGEIQAIPAWLLHLIRERCAQRGKARSELWQRYANDAVVRWSIETLWEELLTRHDWRDTNKLDRCGCRIWEKPGGGTSSTKSATAHEPDCDVMPNEEGHGALHLWTTDPPEPLRMWCLEHGTQTLTKLQFVAAMEYGGDVTEAKVALGIEIDPSLITDWLRSTGTAGTPRGGESASDASGSSTRDDDAETDASAGTSDASAGNAGEDAGNEDEPSPKSAAETAFEHLVDRHYNNMAAFAEAKRRFVRDTRSSRVGASDLWVPPAAEQFLDDYFATGSELEPSFLRRTDGRGLLYQARVGGIAGRRSAGKTWSALHLTHQALEDERTVLYYDMEDNRSSWKARLKLIGCDLDRYVRAGQVRWVKPGDLPDDTDELVTAAGAFDVVVFDVMNRLITRRGGNPDAGNEEVIWLYDNLFDPLCSLGACVYVLDHPNRRGQRHDAAIDDMGPAGGAMKMNHASGHVMAMRVITAFSRDRIAKPTADTRPEIHLITLKDREGHFEEGAIAGVMRGAMDLVDNHIGMTITIDPPGPEPDEAEELATLFARLRVRVLTKLAAIDKVAPGKGAKIGVLQAALSNNHQRDYLPIILELLKDEGRITVDDDVYRLVAP